MQLKELKLAGFKSFVDPTTIPLPGQLVAIVGPNGCGKSNIIDAVRWVLGESSAKNLRGEAMVDVIFNGSSERKAIGQASIELVFDNSMGRLIGQYASYQDIAVKRLVTRDGDSAYFLNGSRCRRRDITDLFMGTGASSRGYSIIGQGTISRIIEARPEELKGFLEEAAGISKYKERRRETVSRIEQTQENLARVQDICEELGKQLQRLERQAKAARHYKRLREEERTCRADILALKWQALSQEQSKIQEKLSVLRLEQEAHQAKSAEAFRKNVVLREQFHAGNDAFQEKQTEFYAIATEIARLEESLLQQQREETRLLDYQKEMHADWESASQAAKANALSLTESEGFLAVLQKDVQEKIHSFEANKTRVQEKEAQFSHWQSAMLAINTAINQAATALEQEKRMQHALMASRQQAMVGLEKIKSQLAELDEEKARIQLQTLQNTLAALQKKQDEAERDYQESMRRDEALRLQWQALENDLSKAQDEVHHVSTEHASLLAAQQAHLARHAVKNEPILGHLSRLVEGIVVEQEWQFAAEFVLSEALEAFVVDSLAAIWPEIESLDAPALFLTRDNNYSYEGSEATQVPSRLSEKIQGSKPRWNINLETIYTVASLDEAKPLLATLGSEESILTKNGFWIGKGWLKFIGKEKKDASGLLGRQAELTQLNLTLTRARETLSALLTQRDALSQQRNAGANTLEEAKQALFAAQDALRKHTAEIKEREQGLLEIQARKSTLTYEWETLEALLEDKLTQYEQSLKVVETIEAEQTIRQQEQLRVEKEKVLWDASLNALRLTLEESRAALNHSQLQTEREQLKIQQLLAALHQEEGRVATLTTRLETLRARLNALKAPDKGLHASLHEKMQHHAALEQALNQQKQEITAMSEALSSLELTIQLEAKQSKQLQESIQQEQLQEQALTLRAEGVLESITELNAQIESILAMIPAGVRQDLRERELQDIVDKIKRLGSINLVAIEEYDTELQRKQHLDAQHQDLTIALQTLNQAIEKMDKETALRLRLTFDEVNSGFQALFPRLFGGGRARLELTCDNLLEAGIVVMAEPPGKRNSTIHLLSGGEKAMTAIAFVFAIFQLNPSPFCLLDEVDAPLDEVNVGRFCEMVKEMSAVVQFIFITHNKLTMELAEHLIGVTMREPGVSRIVAVDVEQALLSVAE
ncbi:MAG: chromosome segregation protein SMC [Tatlockia sp.]|jgi:chromosome segregation protein